MFLNRKVEEREEREEERRVLEAERGEGKGSTA